MERHAASIGMQGRWPLPAGGTLFIASCPPPSPQLRDRPCLAPILSTISVQTGNKFSRPHFLTCARNNVRKVHASLRCTIKRRATKRIARATNCVVNLAFTLLCPTRVRAQ